MKEHPKGSKNRSVVRAHVPLPAIKAEGGHLSTRRAVFCLQPNVTLLQLAFSNLSHSYSRSPSHRLATTPAISSMCPVSTPKAATKTPGADCEAVHPFLPFGTRTDEWQNPNCTAWPEYMVWAWVGLSVASSTADLQDTAPCKPLQSRKLCIC